jgi:hypothetical protein
MSGGSPNSRFAQLAMLAMLLLNFTLSWWRWDRVPSVPGYDEALINDGALGVTRLGEVRSPHLETLSPPASGGPGFLLLQGAIFRTFGLTPLTLRISAKLSHMAVCILGLLILRLLWRRGVLGGTAAMVVAILWLTDLAGFWIGRQARMESSEEMLALGAAWILLGGTEQRRRWWAAAILLGLAASMHASSVVLWFAFLLALWFFRERLGWGMAAACALLPLAVAGVIWLVAFRERSLDALAVFRLNNSYRFDAPLALQDWWEIVRQRSAGRFLWYGGASYWLVWSGWLMALFQFRAARASRWMAFAIVCSLGHAALALFVTDMRAQRLVLYVPWAFLALGLVLTNWPADRQRAALVLAALLGVAEYTGMFLYADLPGDRSPNRFDTLPLPAGVQSVAAGTELWYYLAAHNWNFRMVSLETPALGDYWGRHPEHFNDWDAVILNSTDPTLEWPVLSARPKMFFPDFTGTLVICLRRPESPH